MVGLNGPSKYSQKASVFFCGTNGTVGFDSLWVMINVCLIPKGVLD